MLQPARPSSHQPGPSIPDVSFPNPDRPSIGSAMELSVQLPPISLFPFENCKTLVFVWFLLLVRKSALPKVNPKFPVSSHVHYAIYSLCGGPCCFLSTSDKSDEAYMSSGSFFGSVFVLWARAVSTWLCFHKCLP